MPYLQLDVNGHYPAEDKKRLARKLCETYSRMMTVDVRRISIAIRELGEGGVWRTIDGEPTPVSVLMCDIRRGRSAELRMEVAKALCKDCIDVLGLREDRLNVEFTQHGRRDVPPDPGRLQPGMVERRGLGCARGACAALNHASSVIMPPNLGSNPHRPPSLS
jgi:phenylpyruvate tautomerase PptA (4-oxalocrotonate tautomerase family)